MPSEICGILTDIEGTTTPISFVYDTLFPYAKSRLEKSCSRVEFQSAIEVLRKEFAEERPEAVKDFGSGAPYAKYLMEQDRKSTGLKMLQGLIWEDGYRSGELKGEVFADVVPALQRWKQQGVDIRVFSSGSVFAQKLLFGHSQQGDLTVYFSGYYDTTTGPKQIAGSYQKIAQDFALAPKTILFLSDVLAELDAARETGLQTGLLIRPGNKTVAEHTHATYQDFAEILP